MNKEEAKAKVAELVAKYEHLGTAEVKGYHEAKTKQGFIQPLFQYLGWEFLNTDEVAPEEKASKGRVDYAFKLRGVSQFCLEAKPLKADLTEHIQQAVTYAYNKGVTWAVLTNFEHLQVFNAQTGQRFLNLSCKDYLPKFDRLWLLSRESMETGALNKEAAEVGALPPPLPVEKRLYSQLRQWREELFNQLHLHNAQLTFPQIDDTIQRLFNRLIFIRTCEDRGIEEKILLSTLHQWKSEGRRRELVEALRQVFCQYGGFYDSDLFMLHPLDQAYVESDTLERIIDGLYQVPGGMASYDFSLIDADVLGAVYEQYLGHVARVARERAKQAQAKLDLGFLTEKIELEAKKQKRKEQGIYYTPRWVVGYIVKQTVGRFIQEHSHNEILHMKILDPACGSGSFLIRAYDELLRYHAGARGNAPEELDQWDRLPILKENIFGVDLDMQAVEIARLNLLIRALARREILPTLADNIRQGNSLISGWEVELQPYFGDAWREKKPFNWEEEFSHTMKNGGFDVVIGNPPYVTEQISEEERDYYKKAFATGILGKLNTYRLFIQRGVELLREGGLLSFIVPLTCLTDRDSTAVRRLMLEDCQLLSVVTLPEKAGPFDVVTQATTVIVLRKTADDAIRRKTLVRYAIGVTSPLALPADQATLPTVEQGILDGLPDHMIVLPARPTVLEIIRKLDGSGARMSTYAEVFQGEVNLTNYAPWISASKIDDSFNPLIRGVDVDRYSIDLSPSKHKPSWVKAEKVARQHAGAHRIVTQEVSNMQQVRRIKAAVAPPSCFCAHTTNYLLPKTQDVSKLFLLALLNSKLLDFYFKLFNTTNHLPAREIERLPIPRIELADPVQKRLHDELVALVERMLELNKRLHSLSGFEAEQRLALEKEIGATDEKIDALVYDLYGLTPEERKIVEAA